MKDRAINNFLSNEEKDIITSFLEKSVKRFQTYSMKTRTTPQRLNTKKLQEIYIKKHALWDKAVQTRIVDPSSISTYLNTLRSNPISNPCAIENFLKSLMHIIQQETPPTNQLNMLQTLEEELVECSFSCPCPAESM